VDTACFGGRTSLLADSESPCPKKKTKKKTAEFGAADAVRAAAVRAAAYAVRAAAGAADAVRAAAGAADAVHAAAGGRPTGQSHVFGTPGF
jgi:hypothetical protein